MLRRILACAFAVMAMGLLASNAHAKVLSVGDPAPAITVKKFVKGTPVTGFEKGKLYVVEFWATWCGPCKMSIPHLTELAKQYKDVTFVGVSVWERDQTLVEPFVKEMGDKMGYNVAMDTDAGQAGAMAVNWMQAAGRNGIPTAFVVDKESKIAWIGHPMTMARPLSKIVAGTWDAKAEDALQAQLAQVNATAQKGDFAKALSIVEEIIKTSPEVESELASPKFQLLLATKRDDEAAAYGSKLVEGALKDDSAGLNEIAWTLVDPDKPKASPALVALGVKAAIRADELTKGKDPAIADTLGSAYFAQGKIDKAISTEERAVMLAKGTPMEADLNKNLLKFRQAKK